MNDVLLIQAGLYHLAIPAEKLLEIVDLNIYHRQQNMDLRKGSNEYDSLLLKSKETFCDHYRLWRHRVLSVMHLGHYLNPKKQKTNCRFSLVYQVNNDDMLFLDVDHVYNIIHMDTAKMKPIYHPYEQLSRFAKHIYEIKNPPTLAFILEDSLDLLSENVTFFKNQQHQKFHFDLSMNTVKDDDDIKTEKVTKPKKRSTKKTEKTLSQTL